MTSINNLPTIPANAKAAINLQSIHIESDGTVAGTKITINGAEVDAQSFSFGLYKDEYHRGVHFDYSVEDKVDPAAGEAQIATRTYHTYRPVQASLDPRVIETVTAADVDPKILPKDTKELTNLYAQIGVPAHTGPVLRR